jgi:hypothetical protein
VNCEHATHLISARLDGEIAASDAALLDAHLADCAGCRATAEALAVQDNGLNSIFGERRVAAAMVAERVISELRASVVARPADLSRNRWASWGRTLVAAAAGFCLAILITRPWDQPNEGGLVGPTTHITPVPIAQPVGHLALATGEVFVCPSSSQNWRPLETGGVVQAGMKVRTGPKVLCEFNMNDGSQVRMNADTQVTLTSARHVEVTGGQVYSTIRRQGNNAPFVVKAAPAHATLTGQETAFDVSCSPAKTTCTVVEGSVKMEAAGKHDVVKGGEMVSLADGQPGDKRPVENLMRATQWVDEILVLKGRDNPELARRIDDIFAQLGQDKMWYMQAQEVRRLGDHCIVPLCRYIESDRSKGTQDDEMKRREAARIVGDVATTWAIPELINLLDDVDGDVRYPAAVALQRLTGQDLGRPAEQWRDQGLMACTPSIDRWHAWWEKNKSRFPGVDPDGVKSTLMKAKG